MDLFPEEGGQKGKKHPRLIPFLPGKNYSRFLKNKEVAEKRLPELHRYSKLVKDSRGEREREMGEGREGEKFGI